MFRSLLLPLLLASALCAAPPGGDDASALSVLFVGHDPASPHISFPDMAVERTHELYAERTPAFDAFLRAHFDEVRVVHAADYTTEMSDAVDVTIFDTPPTAIEEAGWRTDALTGQEVYSKAVHLPQGFDRPALMIGEASPRIGEGIGLKLDWL